MPGSPDRTSFTPGRVNVSPSDTQGGSRVPELGSLGSVRGALSNGRPYRDFNPDGPFCVSGWVVLYESGQGDLTMIVEAERNRRLGRGFNSRRLHHEHIGFGVFLRGATWVRLGAIKAR